VTLQNFQRHGASRGLSAIAALLVLGVLAAVSPSSLVTHPHYLLTICCRKWLSIANGQTRLNVAAAVANARSVAIKFLYVDSLDRFQ